MTNTDTTTSTLAPTDPRAILAGAVRTAGAVIAGVRADQMDLPTPCPEFPVRVMLGHLAVVLQRIAALGNGTDPMAMPRFITGVADDQWVQQWTERAHAARDAWTDPATLTREMSLPWVTAPGAAMLASYTAELTVHTWDLAVATGQQPDWDPAVLQVALDAALQALAPGDREANFEAMRPSLPPAMTEFFPPFKNAVDAADTASVLDRLVAWYGRQAASAA